MSDVANKDLCAELYEMSGWETDTYFDGEYIVTKEDTLSGYDEGQCSVVYELGYLLRRLPVATEIYRRGASFYEATYYPNPGKPLLYGLETPEDAACKLAIELFKQGVLTKESN